MANYAKNYHVALPKYLATYLQEDISVLNNGLVKGKEIGLISRNSLSSN